jgi:type VI secretion system protein VasG
LSWYQESHTVSQLKGSPLPGYVGYGRGGVLTEAARQRPYSVVLLDDVEKAHRDVLDIFYQVFDRGRMRDAEGREIDFRNCVIPTTSNIGSAQIDEATVENPSPSQGALHNAIHPQLDAHFPASPACPLPDARLSTARLCRARVDRTTEGRQNRRTSASSVRCRAHLS